MNTTPPAARSRSALRIALLPLALLAFVLPPVAQAHVGLGDAGGLAHGLAHPLTGLDHLCAMLAVGLWAFQRGGRAVWLVPLVFLGVMALGGALGVAGIALPFVERGIVASVLVLGVLIAAATRLPLLASALLVGVFALFHGHAHGAEMPATASGLAWGTGFLISTASLHVAGIVIARLVSRAGQPRLVRLAGAAVAMCGLWLAVSG